MDYSVKLKTDERLLGNLSLNNSWIEGSYEGGCFHPYMWKLDVKNNADLSIYCGGNPKQGECEESLYVEICYDSEEDLLYYFNGQQGSWSDDEPSDAADIEAIALEVYGKVNLVRTLFDDKFLKALEADMQDLHHL